VTKRTALARAKRGAAYLDEKLGRGWRRKIATTRLDMERGRCTRSARGSCGCILAQLAPESDYGERTYASGAESVGINPWGDEARRLGFFTDDSYKPLTDAWREVLSA
jgi:hypothetical protein